jgi:hypothetical protein
MIVRALGSVTTDGLRIATGIAALEDKTVQRALAEVLNAMRHYETALPSRAIDK